MLLCKWFTTSYLELRFPTFLNQESWMHSERIRRKRGFAYSDDAFMVSTAILVALVPSIGNEKMIAIASCHCTSTCLSRWV